MAVDEISDDELVARRIPPDDDHFRPPDRITSANFQLNTREGELGISVYRLSIVGAADILGRPEAISGSLVAVASVGEIRGACDGAGNPLRLTVVASDYGGRNPGHAEIRGPVPGELAGAASKALARRVFRLVSDL